MQRAAWLGFIGAALVAAAGACGDDHSRLAKTDGGAGGMAEGGAGGTGSPAGSSSSVGAGGSGGIEEPAGPTRLTLVNGVVDYPAIRLCFLAYPDASGAELPWPSVQGLPFARGAVIDPIFDLLPEQSDVEVVVLAGDLAATGGESCIDLLTAPPAGVIAMSLGVLGEGVFLEEKSILLVPHGCLGGPGHEDEQLEELVCGAGYGVGRPTASLAAGFLSRIKSTDKLALQFVQASRGLAGTAVRLRAGFDGAGAQIVVTDWTWGAIAPFPPHIALSVAQLGAIGSATIELTPSGASQPISVTPLSTAFANSSLSAGDLEDGDGVAFVGVGAAPPIQAGAWWRAFTFVAVASDP